VAAFLIPMTTAISFLLRQLLLGLKPPPDEELQAALQCVQQFLSWIDLTK
jgi:hypothetical protein